MDDKSVTIKKEDTIFSSKNFSSNSKLNEFVAVEAKIKNEAKPEVAATYATFTVVSLSTTDDEEKKIKVESIDSLSEGLVSPAESTLPLTDSSSVTNVDVIIKKEEDLGTYFEEEEGTTPSDFNSCVPFDREIDPHCSDRTPVAAKLNHEVDDNETSTTVHVVSSLEAEASTKCDASRFQAISPPESPFVCTECGSGFTTRRSLKEHLNLCHQKSFLCAYCLAAFSFNACLKVHLATHFGKRLFQCKRCTATFKDKNHFVEHLVTHSSTGRFSCVYCCAELRSPELRIHLAAHTSEEPVFYVGQLSLMYPCNACTGLFESFLRHKAHVASFHAGEPISSAPYSSLPQERKDIKCQADHSLQNSSCSLCPAVSSDSQSSKIPRSTDAAKPDGCSRCSCRFENEESLLSNGPSQGPLISRKRKPSSLHGVSQGLCKKCKGSSQFVKVSLSCDQCGRQCKTMGRLKRHLISHVRKEGNVLWAYQR